MSWRQIHSIQSWFLETIIEDKLVANPKEDVNSLKDKLQKVEHGRQDKVTYVYDNRSYNIVGELFKPDVECYLCHNLTILH